MYATVKKSILRGLALAAVASLMAILNAGSARAQWSAPNPQGNISSTNTGNVGVGTASPSSKLHVYNQPTVSVDIQSANASGGGWTRLRLMTSTRTYGWFVGDSSMPEAPDKIGLYDYTAGAFRMMVDPSGNVGIGTPSPSNLLHIKSTGGLDRGVQITSASTFGPGLLLESTDTGGRKFGIFSTASANGAGAGKFGVYDYVGDQYRFLIDSSGNVGIGTTAPASRLHVAGNITVDGNVNAKYQDVAEWVPSTQKLRAGTVVVVDAGGGNRVLASSSAYDTRVAGVVSAQPGITLGERAEDKALVATTGRVKVRVDATRAPIRAGDLLVTSDVAGVAMKSEPVSLGGVAIHRPGTIIGKALEALDKGTGEILVLLSLQ